MRRTSTVVALATTAAVLAVPAGAGAHVTINPREAAGSFSVLAVRVPNERDRASTLKLDLRFPTGFASVSLRADGGLDGAGAHALLQRRAGALVSASRTASWRPR